VVKGEADKRQVVVDTLHALSARVRRWTFPCMVWIHLCIAAHGAEMSLATAHWASDLLETAGLVANLLSDVHPPSGPEELVQEINPAPRSVTGYLHVPPTMIETACASGKHPRRWFNVLCGLCVPVSRALRPPTWDGIFRACVGGSLVFAWYMSQAFVEIQPALSINRIESNFNSPASCLTRGDQAFYRRLPAFFAFCAFYALVERGTDIALVARTCGLFTALPSLPGNTRNPSIRSTVRSQLPLTWLGCVSCCLWDRDWFVQNVSCFSIPDINRTYTVMWTRNYADGHVGIDLHYCGPGCAEVTGRWFRIHRSIPGEGHAWDNRLFLCVHRRRDNWCMDTPDAVVSVGILRMFLGGSSILWWYTRLEYFPVFWNACV